MPREATSHSDNDRYTQRQTLVRRMAQLSTTVVDVDATGAHLVQRRRGTNLVDEVFAAVVAHGSRALALQGTCLPSAAVGDESQEWTERAGAELGPL